MLRVWRAVADAVVSGVVLVDSLAYLYSNSSVEKVSYVVRAAVHAEVSGQRNSSAEAEEHAQSVKGDVDDGDAELVDERGGQEVHQCEQPPDADEERVVDNGVGAVCCAVDVVSHKGCDEDGADEL